MERLAPGLFLYVEKNPHLLIRYFSHKEINKRKWDECISSSVNGRIYAYTWYLDIVADQWDALILDNYQAVFPLPFRRKLKMDYIYQPIFTQQLGLFSKVALTPDLLEEFLAEIPLRFKFTDLNLNQHNILKSLSIPAKSRRNIQMDLLDEYALLRQSYSTNLKRNLKKASQAKLTIFENLKPDAVIQLFKANKGKKLGKYTKDDYSRLLRLIYKALQLGHAEVWGAYTSENNLCAAAVFMRSHRRITFLFSGANEEARQNAALPYLLDAYLNANAGSDLVFDFEGSNDDQLARFYLGFGSKSISYSQIQWVRTSFIIKPFVNAYLKFRSLI